MDDWSTVAEAAAAEAGGVDPALLGDYLRELAAASAAGARLDDGALARCHALGGRAAEQGVPLRALVDLYLSATWRAWRALPAVRDAADLHDMHDVGEAVLRAADDAVAAAAEGFQAARRWAIRREEAARREFVDDLLSGTGEPSRLLTAAERFGVDVVGGHVVVVLSSPRAFRDATPVVARVENAVAATAGDGALVATKEGQLVCVLPTTKLARVDAVIAALSEAVASRRGDRVWRCGVGRGYGGPAGVVRSYDEARDALRLADLLELPDAVVRIADLLVYRVLLRDREAIADLIDSVLTPLRGARGGPQPLLDTIATYAATGANAAATARRIHLSFRAVTYRLSRLREITGHVPGVPDQLYVLQTAALGARLLGWPASNL
jgi:DNA-binding PucR family transcriptional regulator